MSLTLGTAFLQTLLLSLILTPITKQLALKMGAVDIPNGRKVHTQPIPRLGGLAICASIIIILGLYYFLFPHLFHYVASDSAVAFIAPRQGILIAVALLTIFILGVWDDIKTLKPTPKFAVQFIAASIIYFAGFKINLFPVGKEIGFVNLDFILSFPLTVLWIVGITNAFNLIDGLDGLASGVAVIALSTIAVISLLEGQLGIVLISLLLCGAITGFLWYNFRPATIFLGDSGSLLLGFILSLLSIDSFTKTSTAFAILVPLLALGLPIIDTLLSMIRRFFSWFIPENEREADDFSFKKALKSLFQPDKSHIHHQLIERGLSHKNTVLVLYTVSILLGLGALIISTTRQSTIIVGIILMLGFILKLGIGQLKYKEIDLLHNGIFFVIYKTLVINKRHFRKFLDSFFILIAFLASYYLIYPEMIQSLYKPQYQTATMLGSIFVTQLSVLWFYGLYKETIRRLGIADVLTILKAVGMAVSVSLLIHYLFFQNTLPLRYTPYILDFYFLATLILGIRVSFHILKYLFYKSRQNNKRVLICGAGKQGLLALQRLMNINSGQYTPVGFIDEDPAMEGRIVNGFSVFGGHWKLKRLIKTKNIDELHIASPDMSDEVKRRIQKIANEHGLQVRILYSELRNMSFNPTTNNQSNTESFKYVN